jgi:O-antigen ligase
VLIYTYAFLVPLESILSLEAVANVGVGTTITKVYGVLIGGLIVFLRPTFFLSWRWTSGLLVAWLLWATLSTYLNNARVFNSLTLNVLFALTLPCCLTQRRHLEWLWFFLSLGGTVAAVLSVINPRFTYVESRLIGLGDLNANYFVVICDLSVVCILYYLSGFSSIALPPHLLALFWLALPLLIWAIAATGSRTGWASLGAAFFLSAWIFAPPTNRRWLYRLITLIAIFGVLAMIATNAALADRARAGLAGHTSSRDRIWAMALQMFYESADPLFGMGLRQADLFLTRYVHGGRWYGSDRLDIHSTYLTVLLETGIVGLLLFLAATVFPVVLIIRQFRRLPFGIISAALPTVMLTSSIAKTWYTSKLFWLIWISTISALHLLDLDKHKPKHLNRVQRVRD